MYTDVLSRKEIIIFLIVFFIAGLFLTREVDFNCPDAKSYCTLTTTNLYNIQNSKKQIAPDNIRSFEVEGHIGIHSSSTRRGSTYGEMYRMVIRTKTGKLYRIHKSSKNPEFFYNYTTEITECLQKGNYPCKFHIY